MTDSAAERSDDFGDNRWKDLHERFASEAKGKEPEVVFVGSSHVALLQFSEAYKELLDPLHCLCFGSIGDRVSNVLWRLEKGEIDPVNPKVIVLWTGEADAGADASSLTGGVVAAARLIATRAPSSQLFVLKLLPSGHGVSGWRDVCTTANRLLVDALPTAVPSAKLIDVDPGFVGADGSISHMDMFDFCHLSQAGYGKVVELIQVALNSILNPDQ